MSEIINVERLLSAIVVLSGSSFALLIYIIKRFVNQIDSNSKRIGAGEKRLDTIETEHCLFHTETSLNGGRNVNKT